MSGWLSDFVGRPWREGASGPLAYDCRGLVLAVQRQVWCREVPALMRPGAAVTPGSRRAVIGWSTTEESPRPGDVLVLRSLTGPHVGVFVEAGRRVKVLHAHGRMAAGRAVGRVWLNTMDELLAGGYARPQVWRCAA